MSGEAVAWAKRAGTGLGVGPYTLLLLIADYADQEAKAWPGIGLLSEMIGTSERSIMRWVKVLEGAGLIEKTHRTAWCALDNPSCLAKGPHKHRTSNLYQLRLDRTARPREDAQPQGVTGNQKSKPDNLSLMEKTAESSQSSISDNLSLEGFIPDNFCVSNLTPVSPICNSEPPDVELPDLTLGESFPEGAREASVGLGMGEADQAGEVLAAEPLDLPDARASQMGGSPAGRRRRRRVHPRRSAVTAVKRRGGTPGAVGSQKVARGPSGDFGDDGVLVAECLPPALQALDRQGLARVAGMLRDRLDAGWKPSEIRALMDQKLPPKVHRLAALVASRLEANVDVQAAPARLREQAEKAGRERRDALREHHDQQVADAVGDVEVDPEFEALIAQVAAEMPDANWATWTRIAMDRRGEGGASA